MELMLVVDAEVLITISNRDDVWILRRCTIDVQQTQLKIRDTENDAFRL